MTFFSEGINSFGHLKIKPSKGISLPALMNYNSGFSPFLFAFHHFHKDELV
jgi:hypothetical protein